MYARCLKETPEYKLVWTLYFKPTFLFIHCFGCCKNFYLSTFIVWCTMSYRFILKQLFVSPCWHLSPWNPAGHLWLHSPVLGSHDPPPGQSHGCSQPAPKKPGSHSKLGNRNTYTENNWSQTKTQHFVKLCRFDTGYSNLKNSRSVEHQMSSLVSWNNHRHFGSSDIDSYIKTALQGNSMPPCLFSLNYWHSCKEINLDFYNV